MVEVSLADLQNVRRPVAFPAACLHLLPVVGGAVCEELGLAQLGWG